MKGLIVAIVLGSLLVLSVGVWLVIDTPASVVSLFRAPAVATSTIQATTKTYMVTADFPQFGIAWIDEQIRADVLSAVTEFTRLPPNPADSATPQNSFTGTFADAYVGDDVVSVQLILSQYTGGAHGQTLFSGVNFDRMTGKRLLLNDVLPLIGKSVQTISAEVTAHFEKKFGDGFFSEGATSNSENFSSFIVSKDAVTLIFQQYQVAAYVHGPQYISFPRVK